MTTVAYDGKFLAADSRSTAGNSSTKAYKCSSCGEQSSRVTEETIKLAGDFDGKQYRNEVIHAVAGAGMSRDIERMIKLLREGEDLDYVNRILEKVHEGARSFTAALIIVTEKSVFKMMANQDTRKMEVKRYDLTEKVAIGSGGKVAEFTMKVLNCSAVQAVQAAITTDEASGGAIRYVDVSTPLGKEDKHSVLESQDAKTHREQVASAVFMNLNGVVEGSAGKSILDLIPEAGKPAAKTGQRARAARKTAKAAAAAFAGTVA